MLDRAVRRCLSLKFCCLSLLFTEVLLPFDSGRCYSFLGQNEEALQDYDEAIRLDPDDDILYQNRGTQLWIMVRHPELNLKIPA